MVIHGTTAYTTTGTALCNVAVCEARTIRLNLVTRDCSHDNPIFVKSRWSDTKIEVTNSARRRRGTDRSGGVEALVLSRCHLKASPGCYHTSNAFATRCAQSLTARCVSDTDIKATNEKPRQKKASKSHDAFSCLRLKAKNQLIQRAG